MAGDVETDCVDGREGGPISPLTYVFLQLTQEWRGVGFKNLLHLDGQLQHGA